MQEGARPDSQTEDPPVLSGLTDEQRRIAQERFEMLRPFLEHEAPLTQTARQQGVPERTLRRWAGRYRALGLAGLVRKRRIDREQHRFASELVCLIEGLALKKPALSAAAIHRQVREVAARQGWPAPSYSTVYALRRSLEPALMTLAHEGTRAYAQTFDLLHRREAQRPNEIWQADHCLLDIWVRDEKGQAARPWLTVILDDYSRAAAGFFLSLQNPSALGTALALRQAIWRKQDPRWHVCGIPDTFYTDHGSDFTSRHMEQVAADLKVRLVFSAAGVPRGRGKIERFFQSVNQLLLCLLPGHSPPGSAPPQSAAGGSAASLSEAQRRQLLDLPALEQRLREFVLGDYLCRPHSQTGFAPQERWEAQGFLPRMPQSLEQLDLLLLTVARPRRVHGDGIHFQGLRYLDLTLAAYVGEDVLIRYDPRDLAEIRVFYRQRFLCRALCPELAGTSLSLRQIVEARRERRRQLSKTIRERRALVESLLEGEGMRRIAESAPHPEEAVSPEQPAIDKVGHLKRYVNE